MKESVWLLNNVYCFLLATSERKGNTSFDSSSVEQDFEASVKR